MTWAWACWAAMARKDQLEKLQAIYRKEVGSPRKDR